jgi:hypothetical protein
MRYMLFFFVLATSSVSAQDYEQGQKTELNKFVLEKDVEWAIYKNDTLFTDEPDLRKMLIDKAIAKKIKIFYPRLEGSKSENKIEFIGTADYEFIEYGHATLDLPAFDENGNITSPLKAKAKIDFTELEGELGLSQILYSKNGMLYSHINRISPMINIRTAQGMFFGKTNHFSTAFNTKLKNFNSKSDKIIFLKKTSTEFYVDSIKKENKLKEMFGHNVIETLWPYIQNNKIALYSVPENKKVNLHDIKTENLLNLETVNVPMYDSIGNLSGNKLVFTEIIPTIFDRIRITQEWYYNETKNIVFCKIPDAILSTRKVSKEDKATHEIKIVF